MTWVLPGPTRPEPLAVVEVVVTITVSDRWTLCEWVTGTLRVCDEDRRIGRGDATVGIERLLACCCTCWWCSSVPRRSTRFIFLRQLFQRSTPYPQRNDDKNNIHRSHTVLGPCGPGPHFSIHLPSLYLPASLHCRQVC